MELQYDEIDFFRTKRAEVERKLAEIFHKSFVPPYHGPSQLPAALRKKALRMQRQMRFLNEKISEIEFWEKEKL